MAIFQVNLGSPVFIEAKDDGGGGDNYTEKVVQSCSQIITTNKPTPSFFTGRMPIPVAQPGIDSSSTLRVEKTRHCETENL